MKDLYIIDNELPNELVQKQKHLDRLERDTRIVALRREGRTLQEIADSVGLTLQMVWRILKKAGEVNKS